MHIIVQHSLTIQSWRASVQQSFAISLLKLLIARICLSREIAKLCQPSSTGIEKSCIYVFHALKTSVVSSADKALHEVTMTMLEHGKQKHVQCSAGLLHKTLS